MFLYLKCWLLQKSFRKDFQDIRIEYSVSANITVQKRFKKKKKICMIF